MSIIDRFLTALAPYECLACSAEGSLLCGACIRQLTTAPERCYRCQKPSAGALTCRECGRTSHLYRVQAGTVYRGAAKDLLWKLKFDGARTASTQMASHLLTLLETGPDFRHGSSGLAIVPVPTAVNRVRGRGYDQAKLLARELSRQARLPYLDCLARSGRTRQVGKSRQRRLEQLDGAFRISPSANIRGKDILLIDDVLTTGATLETAAGTLKTHDAGRIVAMVFAQA